MPIHLSHKKSFARTWTFSIPKWRGRDFFNAEMIGRGLFLHDNHEAHTFSGFTNHWRSVCLLEIIPGAEIFCFKKSRCVHFFELWKFRLTGLYSDKFLFLPYSEEKITNHSIRFSLERYASFYRKNLFTLKINRYLVAKIWLSLFFPV